MKLENSGLHKNINKFGDLGKRKITKQDVFRTIKDPKNKKGELVRIIGKESMEQIEKRCIAYAVKIIGEKDANQGFWRACFGKNPIKTSKEWETLKKENDNLRHLCYYGNKEIIELFLSKTDFATFAKEVKENYNLRYLCKYGNKEIIEFILKDTDFATFAENVKDNENLRYLCEWGNKEIIELFLSKTDFATFAEDVKENENLRDLCQYGNKEIIELILNEIDFATFAEDVKDNDNLSYVCINGNTEIIELILKKIDFATFYEEVKDNDNLIDVCLNGNTKIIDELFTKNLPPATQGLQFNKCNEEERERNAKKVNEEQKECKKVKEIKEIKKRTLVIYTRDENIVNTKIIIKTLNWLIENNYTKIFTDIKVIPRRKNKPLGSIEKDFPEIKISYVWGDDFREACSIGANTIHLGHGSPESKPYNSVPILTTAIINDPEKMEGLNAEDYVLFDLELEKNPPNTAKIIREIIKSIMALEEKMLK